MPGNDGNAAMDPAAQAAAIAQAEAAFRSFTIELFTLFGIGVLSTVLRTYARIKKVGLANLAADDFLVWLGLVRLFLGGILHTYPCTEARLASVHKNRKADDATTPFFWMLSAVMPPKQA